MVMIIQKLFEKKKLIEGEQDDMSQTDRGANSA